jgi:hypothetical protein
MSFSLPLEPELAPSGWRLPHRRLALISPFCNGIGTDLSCKHHVRQDGGEKMALVLYTTHCQFGSELSFERKNLFAVAFVPGGMLLIALWVLPLSMEWGLTRVCLVVLT